MHRFDEIKNNYKKMSDSEIEKIALFESIGLQRKVIEILRSEIKIRGLNSNLLNWVNSGSKKFEENELEGLIKDISILPCPKCSKNSSILYGYEINKIFSYVISSSESQKEKILCSACGKKEKALSIIQNSLFGWWSKSGMFSTPYLLTKDIFNLSRSKKISKRILNKMIINNTGYLRMNGDKESLIDFINRFNKR